MSGRTATKSLKIWKKIQFLRLFNQIKKMIKWPYLRPGAPNPKNKDTLYSSNFKVEEKKVTLFFGFGTSGLRYGHSRIFMKVTTWSQIKKMRKWPYLSPGASNPKNNDTLFSSTFKVEEKEGRLFLDL